MITVYGTQGPHVGRLRAALIQKGLDFQHVSVNMSNKSEEFQDLTLTETLPVMDDNGIIFMHSIYAIDYLDRKYPKTHVMLGKTEAERILILNVVAAVDKISEYLPPLYIEKFNMAEGFIENKASHRAIMYNKQQKEDLQKEIDYRLGKIKAVLGNKKFFTEQFSAAEASLLGLLGTVEWLGMPIDPELKSWEQDLSKDPKVALMIKPQEEKVIREI